MKTLRLLVILSVLGLLVAPLHLVQADGDSPWADILNPDGSVQWDKLTDLGTTSQPASWMTVTLPGGMTVDLDATYHRYQTPGGNVVVLPSPVTLFFMALHPGESGLTDAQSMIGNGATILDLLIGPAMSTDQLAQLLSKGYTDPKAFFQAVIDGKENIWSFVNPTFLFELARMSFDSGFLVNALLLYINGVADCADIPGGCNGLPIGQQCVGDDCIPTPKVCPSATITQGQPTLSIQKVAPDHPLVVGQDPARRGADIQVSASIPPVVFTWYETIQERPSCRYDSAGDGAGCGGPADSYKLVADESGQSINWDSSMVDSPTWQEIPGATHCIQHVEVLPETITSLQATAELNAESRYWILNDLAEKFYQASIHQPAFTLVPGMAQVSTSCDGNHVCSAKATAANIPFADPGTFDLKLWVTTSGTSFTYHRVSIPITQPRVLYAGNSMQVYVTLVTLLPAGDQ